MNNKSKIAVLLTALVISFAAGRYTTPVSVKTEDKTAQTDTKKEKEKTDVTKDEHKKTVITDVTKPDGTHKKVTVITDDKSQESKKSDNITSSSSKSSESSKEVVRNSGKLTVSALAGTKISFSGLPSPDYGAMVCKDILGPINVGIFGFSSGFAGVSVGLSF